MLGSASLITPANSAAAEKSDPVFISHDAQIILERQVQIEPALRLDHFPGANRRSCARDSATDRLRCQNLSIT